ncbi:hypothetical protein CMV_023489 [Castanea mollissima]|uniref:Uncharacterized protein n=1 Tax=Castanea mollissima TaxID=60419 RepID=A0A8J4VJA2_9ROSI|nr:hypothetical protein CMV_023489 [Castanea mollissima]
MASSPSSTSSTTPSTTTTSITPIVNPSLLLLSNRASMMTVKLDFTNYMSNNRGRGRNGNQRGRGRGFNSFGPNFGFNNGQSSSHPTFGFHNGSSFGNATNPSQFPGLQSNSQVKSGFADFPSLQASLPSSSSTSDVPSPSFDLWLSTLLPSLSFDPLSVVSAVFPSFQPSIAMSNVPFDTTSDVSSLITSSSPISVAPIEPMP